MSKVVVVDAAPGCCVSISVLLQNHEKINILSSFVLIIPEHVQFLEKLNSEKYKYDQIFDLFPSEKQK